MYVRILQKKFFFPLKKEFIWINNEKYFSETILMMRFYILASREYEWVSKKLSFLELLRKIFRQVNACSDIFVERILNTLEKSFFFPYCVPQKPTSNKHLSSSRVLLLIVITSKNWSWHFFQSGTQFRLEYSLNEIPCFHFWGPE